MKKIWNSRRTYKDKELKESEIPQKPFELFKEWMEQALEKESYESNAMVLSTVDSHKQPYSRIVLMRDFSEHGIVFFSNYQSNKALQIRENRKVAVLFFWQSLSRQVRILGKIKKSSKEISDRYFYSRPIEHQCGSIASPQSKIISTKDEIIENYNECLKQELVKRPKHWGGYIIIPNYFEFWQGQPSRLHDRIVYKLKKDASWKIFRLAP